MRKSLFKRTNKATMSGGQGDLMPEAKEYHRLGRKAAKKQLKAELRREVEVCMSVLQNPISNINHKIGY